MERPSNKELFSKLRDAKAAARKGHVFVINQEVIAEDAIELGYHIGHELLDVLSELLEETALAHYVGSRPPQRSYKEEIKDLELFAFVVDSRRFNCRVYLKFAVSEGFFWLVSLHQDRPMKE